MTKRAETKNHLKACFLAPGGQLTAGPRWLTSVFPLFGEKERRRAVRIPRFTMNTGSLLKSWRAVRVRVRPGRAEPPAPTVQSGPVHACHLPSLDRPLRRATPGLADDGWNWSSHTVCTETRGAVPGAASIALPKLCPVQHGEWRCQRNWRLPFCFLAVFGGRAADTSSFFSAKRRRALTMRVYFCSSCAVSQRTPKWLLG